MDTAQWPQEIVVKPIEEIVTNTCLKPAPAAEAVGPHNRTLVGGGGVKRKIRPQEDRAMNCPRCNSTNTKFCYYNNYSLSQPRYFCKACRRYWTEGGSLRNIPVGGGSRKNKTSSSSSPSPSSSSSGKHVLDTTATPYPPATTENPKTHQAFRTDCNNISSFVQAPSRLDVGSNFQNPLVSSSSSSCSSSSNSLAVTCGTSTNHHSALELLTGMSSSSSSIFMSFPSLQDSLASTVYTTTGFNVNYPIQEFTRPALSFSLDDGFGDQDHLQQGEGGNAAKGRLLFPFENLKLPISSSSGTTSGENSNIDQPGNEKEQGDNSAGFWNGMLGSGRSWQL